MSSNTSPFDAIWERHPERQRRGSSTWWFFLLAPKQGSGYGPKQGMFSFISLNGDRFKLNGRSHPGLSQSGEGDQAEAAFNTTAVGWIFDGEQLHDEIIHNTCMGTLSKGALAAWTRVKGRHRGAELRARPEQPFAVDVAFRGARGEAQFTAWADPEQAITAPILHDHSGLFVDYNVVAWRHLYFAGEFKTPAGSEWWEGVGYFQRVCLNVPLFPWKWLWAAFADGSVISCSLPYLGVHLLRRSGGVSAGILENATLPMMQGGYFWDGRSGKLYDFERVRMTYRTHDRQPRFLVECRSRGGDFIRFASNPYSHVRLLLERPHLKGLWHSYFNYNEFLVRIDEVAGRVDGRELDSSTLGPGFGNNEYTWGFGL